MKRRHLHVWILCVILVGGLAACGGQDTGGEVTTGTGYSSETIRQGESLYQQTCLACHGPDGKGLPSLGKDLIASEFVDNSSDDELLTYVLEGRAADAPDNTTGVAMPPKGGFEFLTDEDILKIIAYIRSIQE